MRCIDELAPEELKGKRVLVRAGLDVPLDSEGEVSDTFRVSRAIPTLRYLSEKSAKVIILSHIGRDPAETNAPVGRALNNHLPVFYVPDLFGTPAQNAIDAMKDGEILLLENLRQQYDLEKANDERFARSLASLGDMYVNDAFSNSHREHASMVGIPKKLPSFAGFLLRDEVKNLQAALHPPKPALAIIGGAKFETKDPLIRAFLQIYDHVAVVGAIANDVLKAKGYPVGRSRVSEHVPAAEVVNHPNLLPPIDVVAERSDKQAFTKTPDAVVTDDKIVDIGPDTVSSFAPYIAEAQFIIWNGPSGLFEEGYISWTHALAELIAKSKAKKVIGGGDTIAAIQQSGVNMEELGFLSTGGGAMLEYLLKGTLPAIDALG